MGARSLNGDGCAGDAKAFLEKRLYRKSALWRAIKLALMQWESVALNRNNAYK
jgi:hypothetical protein